MTIWDPESGAALDRLRYPDPVWWTAISPDGRLLAAQRQAEGADDSFVDVRELPWGRPLFSRRVRFGTGGLQFSRDSRVLFGLGCCQQGSTVIAWDARSGAERFESHPSAEARTFALAPDSRTLLVGTGEGSVLTLDARTGGERRPATTSRPRTCSRSPSPRTDGCWLRATGPVRRHCGTCARTSASANASPDPGPGPPGRLRAQRPPAPHRAHSASEWPVDRPTLQRFACRVAGRSLSRDEWRAVLPNQPYRRVCP